MPGVITQRPHGFPGANGRQDSRLGFPAERLVDQTRVPIAVSLRTRMRRCVRWWKGSAGTLPSTQTWLNRGYTVSWTTWKK